MGFCFFSKILNLKNIQKKIHLLGFFLIASFCVTFSVGAQELGVDSLEGFTKTERFLDEELETVSQALTKNIPTRLVEPLQLIVNDPEPGLPFSGEVLSRRYFDADKLTFQIYNDEGLVQWEGVIALGDQTERVIPFYFTDMEIQGASHLVVKAQNDKMETLAMGARDVDFPFGTKITEITKTTVNLEEDNTLHLSLELESGAFNEILQPYVFIYKESRQAENLYYEYEDLPIKLFPKEKKKIAFNVDKFLPVGPYIVEVGLKNFRTKEVRLGYFQKHLFSEGDYLRLDDILFQDSEDLEDSIINLQLSGASFLQVEDPLNIRVLVFDEGRTILETEVKVVIKNGYFKYVLELDRAKINPTFKGEVHIVSAKGVSLAEQTFDFLGIPQSKPQEKLIVNTTKEVQKKIRRERVPFIKTQSKSAYWSVFLTENTLYFGGGGIIVFLLLFLFKRRHSLFFVGVGTGLYFASTIFAIAVPFYPTVEWIAGLDDDSAIYNPGSQKGFQIMPLQGRIYNGVTGAGFFERDIIDQWRINFINEQGEFFQFKLSEDYLLENSKWEKQAFNGYYRFYLDLSKFEGSLPLGESSDFSFSEGQWKTQLLFNFNESEKSSWYATDFEAIGTGFTIDRTPPEVTVRQIDFQGQELESGVFTNKPINLEIHCRDALSNCLWKTKTFEVLGNFCSDGTICDNTAAREISVCDLVQNCTKYEVIINSYDPVPPRVDFFKINNSTTTSVEADYKLSLRYKDPRKSAAVEENLFLPHVCSTKNSGYFLNKERHLCLPKKYPCVFKEGDLYVRGEDFGGGCVRICGKGLQYKNGSCQASCNNKSLLGGEICFPILLLPKK